MPDFTAVLNEETKGILQGFPAWPDVEKTFRTHAVPHCWAVRSPLRFHPDVLNAMSRLYLCDSGTGEDNCAGCRVWSRDDAGAWVHPDRIVAGDFAKAPNIEMCRDLIKELALKPVCARRRIGVILAADKLLVHAANSLLKVAEEPPSHAALLFLLSGRDLLPTLQSRARLTSLVAPLELTARPAPADEGEWVSWLLEMKEDADVTEHLLAWTSYAIQSGDLGLAARTEKLRLLVEQKKLSNTMVSDLLILTLKEELPFEHLFGGFW